MARQKKITSDNWLSVNPFTLDALTVEELRRKGAKAANQRILRLERARAATGERLSELSDSAQYAYDQIRNIRTRADKPTRSKKGRFRESHLPPGESQARMELYVIQSFLSDDRTKAGTAARYVSKTEKAFLERGMKVASFKSFYNFLNSAAFAELAQDVSSDDIVEVFNKAHESGKSFRAINEIITGYMAGQEEKEEGYDLKGLQDALGIMIL